MNSFKTLFPYLSDGGVYIVEDLGGSYTKAFNGDPNFDPNNNMFGFIQDKIHAVNSKYLTKEKFEMIGEYVNIKNITLSQDCLIIHKNIKDSNDYLSYHDAFRSLSELNNEENYNKDLSGFINSKKYDS